MKKIYLFLLLNFLLAGYLSAQTTVTLNAVLSGKVTSADVKTNGDLTNICSSCDRGYIKFDLSSIPSTAVFTAATLNLTAITGSISSSAVNKITTTTLDAASAGAGFYAALNSANTANSSAWSFVSLPTTFNLAVTSSGLTDLQNQLVGGQVTYGVVRGSTNVYVFGGYTNATTSVRPTLTLSYALPCSGAPTGGTISGPPQVCSGSSFTLSSTGTTIATGMKYSWQSSPDNITFTNLNNTTSLSPLVISQTVPTYYRMVDTCLNSGLSAISNVLQITMLSPAYATLPFSESFESNWIDGCGASGSRSIPNNSWRNTPVSGNNSWRRNDEIIANSGWSSTSGAYAPTSSAGTYSARFHTYNTSSGTSGTLDLYLDCSSGVASKQLTFDFINTSGTDSLSILYSTDNGTTFIRLDSIKNRTAWSSKTVNFTSSSATTIIRFKATSDFGTTDIGLDNVNVAVFTGCSGTPAAGTISGPASTCSGTSFSLTNAGATVAGGMNYAWQSSASASGPWANIAGQTNPTSANASQTAITFYRFVDTCTNSGLTAISNVIQVTLINPTYATLPFSESFETNWIDGCGATGSRSIPNNSWRNTPLSGNTSWRRNDEITANSGWSSLGGSYAPASSVGTFSARFHSYDASSGTSGTLDLYLDCSAGVVSKQATFDYINTSGNDSLSILFSTDNGITFTRLDSVGIRTVWSAKTVNFNSSSATTILRFKGTGDFGFSDIGLDNVNVAVFTGCTGTPAAGTISGPASACSATSFTLSNAGATVAGGMNYAWQSSASASGPWANIAGQTNPASASTSQTAITFYRFVDTCLNSGLSAISNVIQVTMNAPSNCYCLPTYASGCSGDNIASDSLGTLQDNGLSCTPVYEDRTLLQPGTLAIPSLNAGTSVTLKITFGTDGNQYNGVWVDFNQNGIFETTEYFTSNSNAGSGGTAYVTINIPANALAGNTRLRIRGGDDSQPTSAQACGAANSSYGSARDYLVNIIASANCAGTPSTPVISGPSSICASVSFSLSGSGYSIGAGLNYAWQSSPDGTTGWTNISGQTSPSSASTSQTSVTYYRLVDTCTASGLTSISNVIQVNINPPSNCYCIPLTTTGCGVSDRLDFFRLKGESSEININTTGICYPNAYKDSTSYPTIINLAPGKTYWGQAQAGTSGDYITAWLDANNNGFFENSERLLNNLAISSGTNTNFNLFIPLGTAPGNHRLRIRLIYNGSAPASVTDPCTNYTYSDTRDYLVNIAAGGSTYAVSTYAPTGSCYTGGGDITIDPSSNNNSGYVPLVDSSNNIIAQLYPLGNDLGTVSTSYFKNGGAVRADGAGKYYLDRNYTISVTKQPASNYNLRLFFKKAEMDALIAQPGSGVHAITDLNVTKNSNVCLSAIVSSPGTVYSPTGFGNQGTDSLIDLSGLSGFSSFYLHGGVSPLPIKIEYFRGAKIGNTHQLDWKVSCTFTQFAIMNIEVSSDARNFHSIYTTNETALRCLQPFSFVNTYPMSGMNYYRLKMTDDHGASSYSNIVALMNANKGFELVGVTPNPVTDGQFYLNISSAEQVKMQIVISDITGRIVLKQNASIIAGFNTIDLHAANLAKGTYQIYGFTIQGKTRVLQFVKE